MRVRPQGNAESPGESEVGELEVAVLVNEQVLGLEIAVQNAVGVEVVDTLDELVRLLVQSASSERLAGAARCRGEGRRDVRISGGDGRVSGRVESYRMNSETHLDNVGSHALAVADFVHVTLEVHVEELKHEVELRIRVDNVKEPGSSELMSYPYYW